MTRDVITSIRAALDGDAAPSSDFDLNPEVVLPKARKLRAAGVLIPFIERDGQWHVILTMRSSALKHHPGQIAFPGGKQDEGDADIAATALREADEEIGLLPQNVEVFGALPIHETVTGFRVTPVLGRVKATFVPRVEVGEVAEVFEVPFAHLANSENYVVQARHWRGQKRYYHTVPYGPYYIWGATARMLFGLAKRMV